jgi:hypothetical protein
VTSVALGVCLFGGVLQPCLADPTKEQMDAAHRLLIAQFDRLERELTAIRQRRVRNYLGKPYREQAGAAVRPPATEQEVTQDVDQAMQQLRDGRAKYEQASRSADNDRTRQLALSRGMEAVRHSLASYQYTLYGVHVRETKWLADVNNARQGQVKNTLADQCSAQLELAKNDSEKLTAWMKFNARERTIDDPYIDLYHQAVQRLEATRRRIAGDYYSWTLRAEALGDKHQAEIFRQDVREKLAARTLNRGGQLAIEAIERPKSANDDEKYYRPVKELRAMVLDVLGAVPGFVPPPENPHEPVPDLLLFDVRTDGKPDDGALGLTAVIYNCGNAQARAGFPVRFYLRGYDLLAARATYRELAVVLAESTVQPNWGDVFLARYVANNDALAQIAQASSLRVVVDSDAPDTLKNNRLSEANEWWNNILDVPGPGK